MYTTGTLPSAPRQPKTVRITSDHIWGFAETCLVQTAKALYKSQAASESEISHGLETARQLHADGKPADLLEQIASQCVGPNEKYDAVVLELSSKVAETLPIYQPVIPFGDKLMMPSAFYDSFEQIHKIAYVLLSPVLYAEDHDAMGTASINPVATMLLGAEIRSAVLKRCGVTPFITHARLGFASWRHLCRKHFQS